MLENKILELTISILCNMLKKKKKSHYLSLLYYSGLTDLKVANVHRIVTAIIQSQFRSLLYLILVSICPKTNFGISRRCHVV